MRGPGGYNCCPSHVQNGPWVSWSEGLLPRVAEAVRSPEPSGLRLLAGVSAPSFLHCFTLASAAFNLQVATPGVSTVPLVSRRVTASLGGPKGPGPQGHCPESPPEEPRTPASSLQAGTAASRVRGAGLTVPLSRGAASSPSPCQSFLEPPCARSRG